jgi:AcrR family transcriptional regulator
VPFEELSTKLIAAEAGMSVGALYRFFPDKEAVLETLERSWMEGDLRLLAAATDPAAVAACASSEQFIARVVEAYADRFRTLPGYRHVWFHVAKVPSLASEGAAVDQQIVDRVHQVLAASFGLAETAETRHRVGLGVALAVRMLGMAFQDDPQGDPEILADIPLVLDRYIFAPARRTVG